MDDQSLALLDVQRKDRTHYRGPAISLGPDVEAAQLSSGDRLVPEQDRLSHERETGLRLPRSGRSGSRVRGRRTSDAKPPAGCRPRLRVATSAAAMKTMSTISAITMLGFLTRRGRRHGRLETCAPDGVPRMENGKN